MTRTTNSENTATAQIETAVTRAGKGREVVDRDTARLLAGAIHTGPGSPLETFAGLGVLAPRAALLEVEQANGLTVPLHWQLSLEAFLLSELQATEYEIGGRDGTV